MTITKTSKVVAAVVGFALALTVFAAVGASTASAQSMTLSQLVDLFVQLGIISPDKAAAAKAAAGATTSATFTKDLTVGSQGADVTALQVAIGVTPATGYFGSITKAAVMSYQTAHGVPSTGYVGPLTRASLNGSVAAGTTPTVPGTNPVVNSGVEGILSADKASVPSSTAYEGDTMKPVLGLKLEAKLSDINIQRVKLDLGTATSIYTKVFKTMYVTDDSGKVLAQADLNSNTVVKDSGSYYLTLGGFSYNVPKGSTKYLWVKADLYASIKTADQTSRTITLVAEGVRGVDGAGIDQLAPATAFSQTISLSTTLSESATLDLSVNSANFTAADVIAKDGSNSDELDKLPLLAFDARANKADIKITDLSFVLTGSVSSATTTNVYLYDGATLVQSESVDTTVTSSTNVVFSDIDNLIVSKDSTKTLTLKADVRSANATATSISATLASATAENLAGTTVSDTGTPAGETMTVRNVGPQFSLVGTPTVVKSASASQNNTSTSTLTATFSVQVTALGADITFGDNGSTTKMFDVTPTYMRVYRDGAYDATISSNATSSSFNVPSSGVTTDSANNSFTLSRNNSTIIPVSFTIEGRKTSGIAFTTGNYSIQLQGIRWQAPTTSTQTSTFMAGKSAWRSPTVVLP